MKQGIFEVFGTGKLGLKADDLNEHADLLDGVGLRILNGIVIATDIFNQVISEIDFTRPIEEIKELDCPEIILAINEEILDKYNKNQPYAIRSSALSERGGTGIYKSVFFWPTGSRVEKLRHLWHCEIAVYASEFTADAESWRLKNEAPLGMAILIQPVVGFHFDDSFLPALSGIAYTSYNGLLTVRAAIGLGTQAVEGGGVIYNYPSKEWLHFQREMWDQEKAEVISLKSTIAQVGTHYEEIHMELGQGYGAFNRFFGILAKLKEKGDFYLEWVISGDNIYIVQCATYEDRLPGKVDFDSTGYFLLLQGSDVLNSGRVKCKCIVFAYDWSPEVAQVVQSLNAITKDYLLIVPQDALSLLADINHPGSRLSFCHFSNALAVVEKQQSYTEKQQILLAQTGKSRANHSFGTGATHFSQLCNRADVLFIGNKFDATPLFALPGGMDYRADIAVTVWRTDAEVIIDAIKKEGYVYVSKAEKQNNYSFKQVEKWSFALRDAANRLEPRNRELADHFYTVHYLIAFDGDLAEFDPLKLSQELIAEFGGKEMISASLQTVLDDDNRSLVSIYWNDGLKSYLQELLAEIKR